LSESSRIQKERLENVTLAISGLSEKLEKGQETLRGATRCDKPLTRSCRPPLRPGLANRSIGSWSISNGSTRASARCKPSLPTSAT
jgi:hypothetical protein